MDGRQSLDLAETSARTFRHLDPRVLFETKWEGHAQIYAMNQDGSHRVCLTPNSDTDYHPALSPDGTTIAFTTHRDGMRALYLMKSDGTDPRRLTNNMAEDRQPSFTMDSRQILFHSNRAGKFEIYAVDLATQKEHRLATEMKDTGDVITLGRSHVVSTAESK